MRSYRSASTFYGITCESSVVRVGRPPIPGGDRPVLAEGRIPPDVLEHELEEAMAQAQEFLD